MASIITATVASGLTQSADNSGVLQLASGTGNLVTVPASTGTFITTTGGVAPSTAGNLLTSNGTAWVSSPPAASGQRYFYAYRTTTQGFNTSNTFVQVQLNNAEQSQTSFNTSTYTWTATASDAGVWMFTGQISFFVEDNNGAQNQLAFYYNGNLDAGNYSWIPASSSGNSRHFTAQNQMIKTISTGDTVSIYGKAVGSAIQYFGGDASAGYRQNSLIGVKIA
jgi:hypothetical protein